MLSCLDSSTAFPEYQVVVKIHMVYSCEISTCNGTLNYVSGFFESNQISVDLILEVTVLEGSFLAFIFNHLDDVSDQDCLVR